MQRQCGQKVAEKALAAGIKAVVFDRGGYVYHGRVAALAEGCKRRRLGILIEGGRDKWLKE